jgi:polyferredoxin
MLPASPRPHGSLAPRASAFLLTAMLLSIVQVKVAPPILLLERFLPGAGWAEVGLLALYASWVTGKMLDPSRSARWRRGVWALFSLVFFAQLAVGLLGAERFLMTGKLHLPVPALILAGPVFRGTGALMLVIFGASVLLVGRAWCSHLCYVGAWDDALSRAATKPRPLPRWRHPLRIALMVLVVGTAFLLNRLGASPALAAVLASTFGLAGVAVMLTASRRTGQMTHCTAFCPLGTFTSFFGLLSPFRVRMDPSCTECGLCRRACRYDALGVEDIRRRKPGISCTLCGDCVGTCREGALGYRFPGLGPDAARTLFIVLSVSLHAVFLGVARM